MRRKKKAVHKTTASSDDKKLGSTLKKMGVTNIPAIEEVNLFKQNGQVIHFSGPKGERVRVRRYALRDSWPEFFCAPTYHRSPSLHCCKYLRRQWYFGDEE